MGFLDFVLAGPRIEHIKMAYVGRYVYNRIKDRELKAMIYWHANKRANQFFRPGEEFDESYLENMTMRTQYVLLALAMMEMGIDHGLPNYRWYFVKKPLLVEYYDDSLWKTAIEALKKQCHIEVEFIPRRIEGSEVRRPDEVIDQFYITEEYVKSLGESLNSSDFEVRAETLGTIIKLGPRLKQVKGYRELLIFPILDNINKYFGPDLRLDSPRQLTLFEIGTHYRPDAEYLVLLLGALGSITGPLDNPYDALLDFLYQDDENLIIRALEWIGSHPLPSQTLHAVSAYVEEALSIEQDIDHFFLAHKYAQAAIDDVDETLSFFVNEIILKDHPVDLKALARHYLETLVPRADEDTLLPALVSLTAFGSEEDKKCASTVLYELLSRDLDQFSEDSLKKVYEVIVLLSDLLDEPEEEKQIVIEELERRGLKIKSGKNQASTSRRHELRVLTNYVIEDRGEVKPGFYDLILRVVQDKFGGECTVKMIFPSSSSTCSEEILKLAEENECDLFILLINNILFASGKLPAEKRIEKSVELVTYLRRKYDKPLIALYGWPDESNFSDKLIRAGATYSFKIPGVKGQFEMALKKCLDILTISLGQTESSKESKRNSQSMHTLGDPISRFDLELDEDRFYYTWEIIEGSEDYNVLESMGYAPDEEDEENDYTYEYVKAIEYLQGIAPHIKWRITYDGTDSPGANPSWWMVICVPEHQIVEAQYIFDRFLKGDDLTNYSYTDRYPEIYEKLPNGESKMKDDILELFQALEDFQDTLSMAHDMDLQSFLENICLILPRIYIHASLLPYVREAFVLVDQGTGSFNKDIQLGKYNEFFFVHDPYKDQIGEYWLSELLIDIYEEIEGSLLAFETNNPDEIAAAVNNLRSGFTGEYGWGRDILKALYVAHVARVELLKQPEY